MYDTILITLDATPTDQAIIQHIKPLAKLMHSKVVLLHVADGWAARTFGPDAVSPEISEDNAYLQSVCQDFQRDGIAATANLVYGDPATEIVRWVNDQHCDLLAMSTHGHRLLGDIFFGTTASKVQHSVDVPVLFIESSMSNSIFAAFLAFFIIMPGVASFAQETGATSQPDKSNYTLLNPTPAEQMRDMDSDRPNKTNTPHTIDAGHLQLEFGFFDYSYDRDRYQGANTRIDDLSLAQGNFRVGVTNNIEVNAVINTWDFQRDTDYSANQSTRQNSVGDTVLGGKFNLWGNDGADETWDTALGIQPQFKIPTGREYLGNGHAELFLGLPFLVNLPADLHLGLQTTVSWERSLAETAYVAGWQNSASIDRVFFDRFDIYLEYWSHVSTEHHVEAQQTIDLGVICQLDKNVAVDTGVNFGLNKSSDTLEWLSGISIRF